MLASTGAGSGCPIPNEEQPVSAGASNALAAVRHDGCKHAIDPSIIPSSRMARSSGTHTDRPRDAAHGHAAAKPLLGREQVGRAIPARVAVGMEKQAGADIDELLAPIAAGPHPGEILRAIVVVEVA